MMLLYHCACENTKFYKEKPAPGLHLVGNSNYAIPIVDGGAIENINLPFLVDEVSKTYLFETKSPDEIPSFIKSYLDSINNGFSIAGPIEEWQSGCDIPVEIDTLMLVEVSNNLRDTLYAFKFRSKKLPHRQLAYFGWGDAVALMAYYNGGFGQTAEIMIFKFRNHKIINYWKGNFPFRKAASKKEILQLLNAAD